MGRSTQWGERYGGGMNDQDEFDPELFLAGLGGDVQLARKILQIFRDSCSLRIESLRAAIEKGSSSLLREEAHLFNGELSYFRYAAASKLIQDLENLGKKGSVEGGIRIVNLLDVKVKEISQVEL